MIVFLTLCYCGLLGILVKVGVVKLNTFWKISPLLWTALLFVALFIPMQWGAPVGPVQTFQYVVEVVPNVSGEVIEVPVEPLVPLSRGDVLFKIDPLPFQTVVDDLAARLKLARTRLGQSERLVERGAGSVFELEQYQAEIASLEAQLQRAEFDLDNTVVRAPGDGYVMQLTLEPGQRVANLPLRSWVSFVVDEQRLVALIHQNQLRHVEVGQPAEVVLKVFPGRTLAATVEAIVPMIGQGQLQASGVVTRTSPQAQPPGPYGVRLKLDEGQELPLAKIPGGAAGTAAIYTASAEMSHVIRKVMMRMDAWMNYLVWF